MTNSLHHKFSKTTILLILEWITISLGIILLAISESLNSYTIFGGFLVTSAFVFRFLRTRNFVPKSGLEIPWLLFIGSAFASCFIAYNQSIAFLQFMRILAAVAIYYSICESNYSIITLFAYLFVLFAVFLSFYWVLQNNFNPQYEFLNVISKLGASINAAIPKSKYGWLFPISIHKNVAAGILVLAIPFSISLLINEVRNHRVPYIILTLCTSLIITIGLIFTRSRGAMIGLVLSILLIIIILIQLKFFNNFRKKIIFWLSFTLLSGIALIFMVFSPLYTHVTESFYIIDSYQSRTLLLKDGIGLIRDYCFTGSGLMTFPMTHATYALLIPVHFVDHVHNSFMEVWIEQGILGVIALIIGTIIIMRWIWNMSNQKTIPILGWAGLSALVIIAIQGLVDVVYYIERTLPVIGFILGYTQLINKSSTVTLRIDNPYKFLLIKKYFWGFLLFSITLMLILFLLIYQPILSIAYSNIGAIYQTREELSVYNPENFNILTLDQVRQSINLNYAIQSYQHSLSFNPGNITALQRLTEIELSLGSYDQANSHVKEIIDYGFRDNVSRLLIGDVFITVLNSDSAASIVSGIPQAKNRFLYQGYYRYFRNDDYLRAKTAWETALLLDPNDSQAKNNLNKLKNLSLP